MMTPDSRADSGTPPTNGGASRNRAWLEAGFVRQELHGDQTRVTVADLTRQTEDIVEKLREQNEPVLILSDYTNVTGADPESREELKTVLGTRYYDRIGVFGVPTTLRIVGELMLSLTGKKDKIQIFDSRENAEAWLREFQPR